MLDSTADTIGKTILLVEDDPLIAMATAMKLEQEGFRVITANTGAKAVEVSRSSDEIDLILMDIDLGPGIDGTQAAAKIRQEQDIPVVFLSSHTDPETVSKTEKITSYGYIVKSAGETVLLASIKMAFRLFEAHQSLKTKSEELKTSNSALRESNAEVSRWQDLLEYIVYHDTSAIAVLDRNLVFRYVSRRFMEDYQIEGGLIGRHHYEAIPEVPEKWRAVHRRALQGEIVSSNLDSFPRGDGRTDFTSWECRPWYERDGSIGGIILYTEVITERVVQEHTFRLLASNTTDLVYRYELLPEPTFSYVSPAATLLTGHSPEDHYRDPSLIMQLVHPEDVPLVTAIGTDPESVANPLLVRWIKPDGEMVWVEQSNTLIYDDADNVVAIEGIARDITERKRSEEQLQTSLQVNRALFDQALVAIYIVDMDGKLFDVNDQASRQSGFSRQELLNMTVFDLNAERHEVRTNANETLLETWTRWEPGEQYVVEATHVKKDGTHYPVLVSTGAIYYGDEKVIAAAVMDITAQKHAEQEVRQLATEREQLVKEMQHRIKNNLNTLMSLISLQTDTVQEHAALRALEDTKNRLNSLGVLYDHLHHSDAHGEGSVEEYLTDLISSEIHLFPNGERVKIHTALQACTCSTKTLSSLGLITNELVTNAMKYAFRDHENPELMMHGTRRDSRYTLTIQDNGPGIPDPDIDRSTGFGLMMIKALTEQLDGTIRFQNDGGTRATLEFPVEGNGCCLDC